MKRIIIILSVLCLGLTGADAQQMRKVTKKFFPDPKVEMNTPAFNRKHGFTSYAEMNTYLRNLAEENPGMMSLSVVGRTQKGKDVMMARICRPTRNMKMRVLYTGCVHGNEQGSTEGLLYFIDRLLHDESLCDLLDDIDFYIVPMVNVDGSEIQQRVTHNGADLNRDQTILSTPEAQTLQRLSSTLKPHLVVDFHEYKPLRASYTEVTDGLLVTNPYDVMFLWSSNPNVAPELRNAVEKFYIPNAYEAVGSKGLRAHTYYTTKSNRGDIIFNVGGSSPRSTSNIMALRGSVSMLMEVRGVGQGRTSLKRRVFTTSTLAESFARTTVEHSAEVISAVKAASKWDGDIAVTFSSAPVENYPITFIDMIANDTLVVPVNARLASDCVVKLSRPRPAAYYLLPSEKVAVETLRLFGVNVEEIESPVSLKLTSYEVLTAEEGHDVVSKRVPMSVSTNLVSEDVTLPAGSWKVSMDQPLSTLIGVLMEPESSNGFVNYRVVPAVKGRKLGVFRQE